MATSFLCKFVSANLQGDGSYILSSSDGETPDTFDWETGDADNAIATPGGTWPAGEPVLDQTGADTTLVSNDAGIPTAFPNDQLRLLLTFEIDSSPGIDWNFFEVRTAGSDDIQFEWIDATPALHIIRNNNTGSGLIEWTSGTLALGTAYAVELRLDDTEAVDNDAMQARIWTIGGAPGSLTSGSEAGTYGAGAAFNALVASPSGGTFLKMGRLIADDDPDTDLSGYDETYPGAGGGATIPIFAQHINQMKRR